MARQPGRPCPVLRETGHPGLLVNCQIHVVYAFMAAISEKENISSVALLFAIDGGDKEPAMLALALESFERPSQTEGDNTQALMKHYFLCHTIPR